MTCCNPISPAWADHGAECRSHLPSPPRWRPAACFPSVPAISSACPWSRIASDSSAPLVAVASVLSPTQSNKQVKQWDKKQTIIFKDFYFQNLSNFWKFWRFLIQKFCDVIRPVLREECEFQTYFFLSFLHLLPLFLSPVIFASDRGGNIAGVSLHLWINGRLSIIQLYIKHHEWNTVSIIWVRQCQIQNCVRLKLANTLHEL